MSSPGRAPIINASNMIALHIFRLVFCARARLRLALGLGLALLGAGLHAQTRAAAPTATPAARSALAPGNGKLLLTGGVSSIDGAAGGGLTPWAVIGSHATAGEIGATAFITRTVTQDYALTAYGAAIGIDDRVELSLARQALNVNVVVPDTTLKLDIAGLKVRVAGDAVLEADTLLPQVAIGIEFKRVDPGPAVGGVLDSVGAKRSGIDVYASATKLFLAQGILVNGTLRLTKANQNGLLGFGSSEQRGYTLRPELSVARLLRRDLAIGAELRFKPNRLAFAGEAFAEDDWKDLFIAWAPSKQLSLTAAYVDLGNIAGHPHQSGAYLSLQLAY